MPVHTPYSITISMQYKTFSRVSSKFIPRTHPKMRLNYYRFYPEWNVVYCKNKILL
uniref:Uncharacterized protein n=1 Tax=Anguilla anguilla TaxID=7936 RepID=A0A0E9WXJ7_ANGAN